MPTLFIPTRPPLRPSSSLLLTCPATVLAAGHHHIPICQLADCLLVLQGSAPCQIGVRLHEMSISWVSAGYQIGVSESRERQRRGPQGSTEGSMASDRVEEGMVGEQEVEEMMEEGVTGGCRRGR